LYVYIAKTLRGAWAEGERLFKKNREIEFHEFFKGAFTSCLFIFFWGGKGITAA